MSHADHADHPRAGQGPSADELFRDVPVQTVDELACAGIFDTDEEVDEFITHVYATRHTDVA